MSRTSLLSIAFGLSVFAAYGLAQQDPPKKRTKAGQAPIVPAAPLTTIDGLDLSRAKTYDGQPGACSTTDGTAWVAWVRYHHRKADDVVAAPIRDGAVAEPVVLSPAPGQYVRPALAAAGRDVWCAWTSTSPDQVASVWVARRSGDGWSPARRLLPDETRAHQNPEVAATSDGQVAVAYQVHNGRDYDVHLSLFDGQAWAPPRALSESGPNDWDPAVAFDVRGELHVLWSAFSEGDYDILWKRGDAPARRISARGEYDLHPSLAAAPGGGVWAAWDVVRIPDHGNSGRTTITGANHKKPLVDTDHGRKGIVSQIDVRLLDGDALRLPGVPREQIDAPKGYAIAHCGLPRLAVSAGGEPWIFHRLLRRDASIPGIGFFWEVAARPFRDGRWGAPLRFAEGDGYLEEPAPCATPKGIAVAYTGESRRFRLDKPVKAVVHEDHHHDFDAQRGWIGEVHLGVVETSVKGPEIASLPEAPAAVDKPLPARNRIEPYRTSDGYRLLWGDTHRHSNVSRCSQGNEPSPDDLYRYGTDICRYDWFALSDHAEDPRQAGYDVIDAYWWKQQKLADLYHVPGAMSVLYNYEWSLTFPHGHHNTIFPERPKIRLDRSLARSSSLEAGWKELEKAGARGLTIPHTGADPGMGTAWLVQDDRYQRLCEIFQACRGSYEHAGCPREYTQTANKKGYYWNALEKGYKVGVIASTDHGFGVSYACVYAKENSREAIWQAMYDRRTYGSTTYGLVVELRSGERWMGEEWASKEAPSLEIYVRGAAPIRSVEILGRSKVLHAEGSVEKPLGAAEHRIRWADPDWAALDAEQWYYVRVNQVDDEMAWSSPVWVKKP